MINWSLPTSISIYFLFAAPLISTAFALSMINLGEMDFYLVPSLVVLTVTHHTTLVVLSIVRKVEPPPIAHPLDSNLANRPASPTNPNSGSNGVAVVRERRVSTSKTASRYPSYTINVANCTIVFLLALAWAGCSFMPFLLAYADERFPTIPRIKVIPNIEGVFMIFESLLLFILFGQLVHYWKKQRSQTRDSIRMTYQVEA
ncbi:hypothetical protein CPB86DRAFT_801261 [Serendipita vermifera]|nr:hypothetical protein CPB86DRAFT_801261 [Serendipita vermifera]